MNVKLGPVFDQFIADLLKSGQYQSHGEVVREGLRMLKEREELKRLRIDELRREIGRDGAQADRGDLIDGDAVFKCIRTKSAGRKTSAR